jgi:hypothetical protein
VNLGNSSADDLAVTASLASTLPIKTNNSYDIGSSTLGLRKLYLGNAGLGATCDIISASHATTREYTVPDCSAAANFVMTEGTQTVNGIKTFGTSIKLASSGATASALNFYAEDDSTLASVTFTGVGGTGGSTPSSAVAITITRIGRVITIKCPEVNDITTSGTPTALQCSGTLPAWARPSVTNSFLAVAYIGGAWGATTLARLEITSAGAINIYRAYKTTTWSNQPNTGFGDFCVSYVA